MSGISKAAATLLTYPLIRAKVLYLQLGWTGAHQDASLYMHNVEKCNQDIVTREATPDHWPVKPMYLH